MAPPENNKSVTPHTPCALHDGALGSSLHIMMTDRGQLAFTHCDLLRYENGSQALMTSAPEITLPNGDMLRLTIEFIPKEMR